MGLSQWLFGASDLLCAIESGNTEKATQLIHEGADVNQKARFTGATALSAACGRDYREIAELLFSKGADPNTTVSSGKTLLHLMAAYKGRASLDMVSFLLSKGANPELADDEGKSALHSACENPDPSIGELLIQSGADIQSRTSEGLTPLHFAVRAGNASLVRLLLDRGANVNDASNTAAASPLHIAAAANDAETAGLLLSRHADIRAKDRTGRTALDIAIRDIPFSKHAALKARLFQALNDSEAIVVTKPALSSSVCPDCGTAFDPAEYRSSVPSWLCSSCRAPLPRETSP